MKVREIAELLDVPGVSVNNLHKEEVELTTKLYINQHSWAGDEGCVAHLIRQGQILSLDCVDCGGWYSQNGTIVRDIPPVALDVALNRAYARAGDIVIVVDWGSISGAERPMVARAFQLTEQHIVAIQAAEDPAEVEV